MEPTNKIIEGKGSYYVSLFFYKEIPRVDGVREVLIHLNKVF